MRCLAAVRMSIKSAPFRAGLAGLILLIFAGISWAAPPPVKIVFPVDNTAVDKDLIGVYGTAAPGITSITLEVTNGSVAESSRNIPVVNGGFTARVDLNKGKCTITASSAQGRHTITVFRLGSAKDPVPQGMKRFFTHRYLAETTKCTECHEVGAGKTDYSKMRIGNVSCVTGSCHP